MPTPNVLTGQPVDRPLQGTEHLNLKGFVCKKLCIHHPTDCKIHLKFWVPVYLTFEPDFCPGSDGEPRKRRSLLERDSSGDGERRLPPDGIGVWSGVC
jgi:hypothetical protein